MSTIVGKPVVPEGKEGRFRNFSPTLVTIGVISLILLAATVALGTRLFILFQEQSRFFESSVVLSVRPVSQLQREILRLNTALEMESTFDEETLRLQRNLVESRYLLLLKPEVRYQLNDQINESLSRSNQEWVALQPDLERWTGDPTDPELRQELRSRLKMLEVDVNHIVTAYEHFLLERSLGYIDNQSRLLLSLGLVTVLYLLFIAIVSIGVRRALIDRRESMKLLKVAHDELEERVAERTRALTDSNRLLGEEVKERGRIQKELAESLLEKETLLKEIHHRVKNNLQIVSSLLKLQAAKFEDPVARQHHIVSVNRINSMAKIHERLYRAPDLAQVDFQPYAQDLISQLFRTYGASGRRILAEIDIPSLSLEIDYAIPAALILNELVTNSLHHAFPEDRSGTISVSMMHENDLCTLRVDDDGIGFPESEEMFDADSLGMQLIKTLADQIEGTLEFSGSNGASVALTFSVRRPTQAPEEHPSAEPVITPL